MQYMVVETFVRGPEAVYARFRERGRLAPAGLRYVSSVVSGDGGRCWQIMECDDRALLDEWMRAWSDLVAFEVVPVISSADAAARFGPPTETEASVPSTPADGAPSSASHDPTPGLYGWITHTDVASASPAATREWCTRVFGWTFRPPMPMDGGELHLFAYSAQGGGAVRSINPPEVPGSIPYVHVQSCRASYDLALREGAEEMLAPTAVMPGVTVAIVRAPGGVAIGLSGP